MRSNIGVSFSGRTVLSKSTDGGSNPSTPANKIMAKKKTSSKRRFYKKIPHRNAFFLGIGVILILFLVLFSKSLFLGQTKQKEIAPEIVVTVSPTHLPTETPSPTVIFIPTATPTPTAPVYQYILMKSTDEIHMHPKSTGYAISATLMDMGRNVITNQNDYKYTWSIDNKDLVMDGYSSFDGCTQGIQPPCPQDHFSFYPIKAGSTVIRVTVTKNNETVATTTFPLIIED